MMRGLSKEEGNKDVKYREFKTHGVTLLFGAVVWIAVIINRFLRGEQPWFRVAMVAIFAFFRFLA
ncbi:MAG: hypothetical protein ACE5NG_05255 [bacterium]